MRISLCLKKMNKIQVIIFNISITTSNKINRNLNKKNKSCYSNYNKIFIEKKAINKTKFNIFRVNRR